MSWDIIAGVAALVVVALIAGTWFAFRAGRNSAQVQTSRNDANASSRTASTMQAIDQAGEYAPRDKAALITALRKGKEGKE